MGRTLLVVGACALLGGGCSNSAETDSDANTSFATSAQGSSGAPSGTSNDASSAGVNQTSNASAVSETTNSTGDSPKFDLGITADVPPADDQCPEDSLLADDGNECAAQTAVYDRQAGQLTLTVTHGELYELNDPNVEIVYASEQPGYESFFLIAREVGIPDVFYMLIADDDFVHLALGECGITLGQCETECIDSPGGGVCAAFVEDFIPLVAAAYVDEPLERETFGRRQIPGPECCDMDLQCNASATTYTEYVVSGPAGTMHFVFQDGYAFLDLMGWSYTPLGKVSGDAEFEFDLCSLPVPEG